MDDENDDLIIVDDPNIESLRNYEDDEEEGVEE